MQCLPKKIIAIDGPAGSGKSTVAKLVAKKLGFLYIDTGAMYRVLTFAAMVKNINLEDEQALVNLCKTITIELKEQGGILKAYLDTKDVTASIRDPEVTNNVHHIARMKSVREMMVVMQRGYAENFNIVMEGRDIGTVVFPNATKKIYLDADFNTRVTRRFKELTQGKENHGLSLAVIARDLEERDRRDMSRSVAPLKKADDAITVDTTNLNINQVVEEIVKLYGV